MKRSTILNKAIMALTGLALVGFLVSHLAGNIKLLMGAEEFNHYAKFLEDLGPALWLAEFGLAVVFLIHIISAIKVTMANKAARPIDYGEKATAGESTFASRSMMITGIVILVFVIFHIKGFKFGDRPNGSLWELVVQEFKRPEVAGFYIVCMLGMGLHLSHGVGSMFQSLGLRNASGHPKLRGLSALIGWGIALGFASLPLWVMVAKPEPKAPTAVKTTLETGGEKIKK